MRKEGNKRPFASAPLGKQLLLAFGIFVIYFILGNVSLSLAFINSTVSSFWAPTGLAIAVYLIFGYRYWPAALLAEFLLDFGTTGYINTAAFIAVGTVIEGLTGAYLIRKFAGGLNAFESVGGILKATIIVGCTSNVISATIGNTALLMAGIVTTSVFAESWFTWWIADFTGVLIFTPLIVFLYKNHKLMFNQKPLQKILVVACALFVITMSLGGLQYILGSNSYNELTSSLVYLCFGVIALVSLLYKPRETAITSASIALIAIMLTLKGYGPFIGPSTNLSLISLQVFVCVISVFGLLLSAIVTDIEKMRSDAEISELENIKSERTITTMKEEEKETETFLNVTAHELKNPIVPIMAQTQLLLKGDFGKMNPKQKESLKMILNNTQRVRLLIGDITDISKIESNALRLTPKRVHLEELVRAEVEAISPRAKEKGIKLDTTLPTLPLVYADSYRISQVILNLLTNAIKFTPNKGTIVITASRVNDTIQIKITDSGIGMPMRAMKKLFTPFYQINSDLSKNYGGSGLGLSICKGIIELHGGKIWAESAGLGKGSTFIFTLPIVKT